jgi:gliding motility-associated-like protein
MIFRLISAIPPIMKNKRQNNYYVFTYLLFQQIGMVCRLFFLKNTAKLATLNIFLLFVAQNVSAQIPIQVSGRRCAADQQCGGDSTTFQANIPNVKIWNWDFGDAATGKLNTSTRAIAKHLYQNAGKYTISLTATLNNGQIVKKDTTVSIRPLPPPAMFFGGKQDTMICESERGKLFLDPYGDIKGGLPKNNTLKYRWFPYGDSTQVIKVDSSGCYSVTVTDSLSGCVASAKIKVEICAEQKPPPKQQWFFGNQAGLEFSGESATSITSGKLKTAEGVSVFTDSNGKLQFYTDGIAIYDRTGKIMKVINPKSPSDTLLAGSKKSTQSVVIVQQPGCKTCEYTYYVFTTQDINDTTRTLSYSIVDMRLNKGNGAITELNTPLFSPTTERLAAAKNPSDSSYYIVTHDYGTNSFRVYNLTKQGLSLPKVYPLGTNQTTKASGEGQMKISSDGKRIGVLVPSTNGDNILEIFDFADTTGKIGGKKITINLGKSPPKAYGLEFSPDGKGVYVSMQGDTSKTHLVASVLYRYDISSADSTTIAGSRITLDSTSKALFGSLQLAPDSKIYLAQGGQSYLGVVASPNQTTLPQIGYKTQGIQLNGKVSQFGLPNTIANEEQMSSGPGISVSDTCSNSTAKFQAGPWCEKRNEQYRWKFDYRGVPIEQLYKKPLPGVQFPSSTIAATISWDTPLSKNSQQASKQYPGPGRYSVVLYIKNDCKDTLIQKDITIKPSPFANLGKDRDTCTKSVTLDANFSYADARYYWYRNGKPLLSATQRTITVTQSGTYEVYVMIDECIAKDEVKVTLHAPPVINLGDPIQNICRNSTLALDAGRGMISYLWNTGAVTQRLPVSKEGTYIVTVMDSAKCTNKDTVTIKIRPSIAWKVETTLTQNCTDATGSLKITDLQPIDTYSFVWYKDGKLLPQTTAGLTGLAMGNYTVLIRSATGCDTTAYLSVSSKNSSISATASTTGALCSNPVDGVINIALGVGSLTPDRYELRSTIGTSIVISGTYSSIITNTTQASIRNLLPNAYSLQLTDKNGCIFSLNGIVVGIAPARLLDKLKDPDPFCAGKSVELDAGTKADIFEWSTGERTAKISVNTAGAYRVIATDSKTQCQSIADVIVKVIPLPIVTVGQAQTVCANSAIIAFTALPVGGKWTGTGISETGVFTPTNALIGSRSVIYTVTQNGCTNSGTLNVYVLPSPPNDLLPPKDTWCNTEKKSINAPEISGATYLWSSGETVKQITPTSSGKYILTVALGTCIAKDTITITINESPRLTNINASFVVCPEEKEAVILDPGSATNWQYQWSPTGEKTRRITVDTEGTYTVKVSTLEGCSTNQQFTLLHKCEPRIYVPEIFTPNGDGQNDVMKVYVKYLTDFDLKIYNRWGEVVFATQDVNDYWDGKYKDYLYPTQSYAWVISYKSQYYPERSTSTKYGAVIVVK